MDAFKHYIHYALSKGYRVRVFDGEEWETATTLGGLIRVCESVDESTICVMTDDESRDVIGQANVLLEQVQQPEESVQDYTITPFNEGWQKAYDMEQRGLMN